MNDRFKFRGVLKLDTQNIVVYSSFLKNYDDELVLSVEERYALKQIKDAGYELTDKDWDIIYRYSDQDDYYPWFNFSCERVEQCTGLKDKNGKLIYEGDIVKAFGFKDYYKLVCRFRDGSFCLDHIDGSPYNFAYSVSPVEVIGNIHENADLLENNND